MRGYQFTVLSSERPHLAIYVLNNVGASLTATSQLSISGILLTPLEVVVLVSSLVAAARPVVSVFTMRHHYRQQTVVDLQSQKHRRGVGFGE